MESIEHRNTPHAGKFYLSTASTYISVIGIALIAGVLFDRIGPRPALALIVAVPFVLMTVRNFKIACSAAFFVLPLVQTILLSNPDSSFSGIRLMICLLALAAISFFFSLALRPAQVKLPRLPVYLILYLAVLFLGAVNGARFFDETPDYLQALSSVKEKTATSYMIATLFVPVFLVCTALTAGALYANTGDSRWVILPVVCSAVILASIVYFFALKSGASLSQLSGQDSRQYLSGSGQHANEIGLTLNTALAITLFVFAGTTNWRTRTVLGCCVLIQAGAVFLTFSRGAYIGSATIVIYFLITQKGKPWTRLALFGVLAGAILVMPGSVLQRTNDQHASQGIDELSSGRVDEIWRPLIPSVLESPLIGRGHGSILWSEAAKRKEILPVGHPHSAYLAALLDTGIIGTAVILAFLAHVWHTFWKLRVVAGPKMLASFFHGASACIPLLLIQGVTDDAFMPRYTQAFLWIAYGAALGLLSRTVVNRDMNHHSPSRQTTTIGRSEK